MKIKSVITYPYNRVHGSISDRQAFVDGMNMEIFKKLRMKFGLYYDKNSVNIEDFCRFYRGLCPEFRTVEFTNVDETEKFGYAQMWLELQKGNPRNYIIALPSRKHDRFLKGDIFLFMHENTHLFDYMSNPKYVANDVKVNRLKADKYFEELYETVLYKEEEFENNKQKVSEFKKIKKVILTFLSKKPLEEKMLYLNYMRYGMEMEEHAHMQEKMLGQVLAKMKGKQNSASLLEVDKYYFGEKKKLLDEIMMNLITSERNRHEKSLLNVNV